MPVKKTKPKFETSDGRTFEAKREADRHEELSTAKRQFEAASKAFNVANHE